MAQVVPSERELDVLKVLWELGEAKVRDVHAAMAPNGELAFTTVQTLLRIMAEKGLVKQRSKNRSLLYTPKYTAEKAASRFLHKVFDGAIDKAVLSMMSSENVSTEEMQDIEKIIAKARKTKQQKGK